MQNPQAPRIRRAVQDVRRADARTPKVALVLGSGLGSFADTLEKKVVVPYASIEGMPRSSIVGHAGNLVVGSIGTLDVVAMQGRVHLYEGHPSADVVFGVRLVKHLGADTLIITNAAGGAGADLEAGDLMIIEDHLNLTGTSCLLGENEDELGVRFPDMTQAYDRKLMDMADGVAKAQGFGLKRGVYAGLLGPSYETPAEIRMLQLMGADAVGMSTVLEVIAARHMGMRVLGISCVTNLAAGISATLLSHDEVTETANRVKSKFEGLLRGVLTAISEGRA